MVCFLFLVTCVTNIHLNGFYALKKDLSESDLFCQLLNLLAIKVGRIKKSL